MKILVTGLCFSGNLGGPALAICLREGIRNRIKDAELIFAVPSEKSEFDMAAHYGCKAIRKVSERMIKMNRLPVPRWAYKFMYALTKRGSSYLEIKPTVAEWKNTIKDCDAVLNLSGISFVGDGMRPSSTSLEELLPFRQAREYNKPYARFIQSFGPFDDAEVAAYAREELIKLEYIFVRGKSTAAKCRDLLGGASVIEDYPDCAIMLPCESASWGECFLRDRDLASEQYVVLSPSAVIRNRKPVADEATGEIYEASLIQIMRRLVDEGLTVVLLPHSRNKRSPQLCDEKVCEAIHKRCLEQGVSPESVHMIADSLDAVQAKRVIANSSLAIVSRYHAVVAAISTATPVVAIGWNIKYKDIMNYYDLAEWALDAREFDADGLSAQVVIACKWWLDEGATRISAMEEAQQKCEVRVGEAFDQLCNWLIKV